MNVSEDAKHFDLPNIFSRYALSQYWTARKVTSLLVNISKYNSVVSEANKKKKPKKALHIRSRWFEKRSPTSAHRK